jgi:uncharacterized protein (TIGR03437 family)
MQPGPLAPGEMIVITGPNLGPASAALAAALPQGAFDSVLAGTRVLFDGIPGSLLYAQSRQVNAIVPYELYGRLSTRLQVEVGGLRTDPIDLRVTDSAPGIFSANGSGAGRAAVLNEDGAGNTPSAPAARGSIIAIYVTGEGQTSPPGQDGRIIVTDLRRPLLPVSVRIGGIACELVYAGSAPGAVSGLMQINARVPSQAVPGGSVSLDVQIGTVGSQSAVTIAVK